MSSFHSMMILLYCHILMLTRVAMMMTLLCCLMMHSCSLMMLEHYRMMLLHHLMTMLHHPMVLSRRLMPKFTNIAMMMLLLSCLMFKLTKVAIPKVPFHLLMMLLCCLPSRFTNMVETMVLSWCLIMHSYPLMMMFSHLLMQKSAKVAMTTVLLRCLMIPLMTILSCHLIFVFTKDAMMMVIPFCLLFKFANVTIIMVLSCRLVMSSNLSKMMPPHHQTM